MSVVGYRGTSPPALYISTERGELEGTVGTVVPYTDPLDLGNTLVDFQYNMDNEALTSYVTLINPDITIENFLFSNYNIFSKTSISGKSEDFTDEELADFIKQADHFYFRWGYVAPKTPGVSYEEGDETAPEQALSHIHRFRLIDMSYEFSESNDRIIKLEFLNTWDANYKSMGFNRSGRTLSVPVDVKGAMRPISEVFEEMLLQMLSAHELYMGFSNFTPEQQNALQASFEAYVHDPSRNTLMVAGKTAAQQAFFANPVIGTNNAYYGTNKNVARQLLRPRDDPTKYQSYYTAVAAPQFFATMNLRDFMQRHGFSFHSMPEDIIDFYDDAQLQQDFQELKDHEADVAAASVPSPAPVTGRPPSPATPIDPDVFALSTGLGDPACTTQEKQVQFNHAGFVDRNRMPGVDNVIDPTSTHVAYCKPESGGYTSVLEPADIEAMLANNIFWIGYLSRSQYAELDPHDTGSIGAPMLTSAGYVWPCYRQYAPMGDSETLTWYHMTDAVRLELQTYLDTLAARTLGIVAEAEEFVVPTKLKTFSEAMINVYGPDAMSFSGLDKATALTDWLSARAAWYYVSLNISEGQLWPATKFFIKILNTTYFKGVNSYIHAQRVEYANIPVESRDHVLEVIREDHPDFEEPAWDPVRDPDTGEILVEADAGMVVLGSSAFMRKLYSWMPVIKSFSGINIPFEDSTDFIRLSLGFTERTDAIVNSCKWKLNKGSLLFDIRRSPVMVQHITNAAKRFESSEKYRQIVAEVVTLVIENENVGTVEKEYMKLEPSPPTLSHTDITVGDSIFVDEAFKRALPQVRKGSVDLGEIGTDDADLTALTEEELKALVAQDLQYILKYEFLDAFFPKIDADDAAIIKQRYYVGTADEAYGAAIAHFRYVAKSPLGVLTQLSHASNDSDNVLMSSKMQALNSFSKIISNVELELLGVPEMDIFENEVMNRNVVLVVHEPRDPGTTHWLTGIYNIWGMRHVINTSEGYKMKMTLIRNISDTVENFNSLLSRTATLAP